LGPSFVEARLEELERDPETPSEDHPKRLYAATAFFF
jgi:hypothetical protein